MTRSNKKPPFANRSSNSSRVRSSAPCDTSILRSENFASGIWLGGPITRSITTSVAVGDIAREHERKISIALLSSQSCRITFMTYGIAPRGDSIEETAGQRFHTIFQSRRCHQSCQLDNLRLIEKHTAACRTRKQDFLQQQTLSATNVDYSRKLFEVVRLKHCARVRKRIARHRIIKNGLFLEMLLSIRPGIHAMRHRVGPFA